MDYTEVKCRNCGNPMKVADGAPKIRCEYCGTEYILSAQNQQENSGVQIIDYGGRGPLFKSYIPAGWNYRVIEDKESVSSLAAVCKGLQLGSDRGAQLIFLPFAYYKDSGQSVIASLLPGQKTGAYRLDPMTLVCHRKLEALPQYAYERVAALTGIAQVQMEQLSCESMVQRAERFRQEAGQKLNSPVNVEAGKYRIAFQANGALYDGYFATILARVDKTNRSNQENMMDMLKKGVALMGAMYGIGGMGSFDWGRAFDILLFYPHEEGMDQEAVLDRFVAELEYGPVYYALQDAEMQNVQQVQLQGAMQRQQTAIRTSQNISRTLSETSDIVNQTCADHSRHLDRMDEKYTEAVRGVNTYTDETGRRYQADVGYDHIYRYGDTFVGSKNGGLELGPQWEELKQRP